MLESMEIISLHKSPYRYYHIIGDYGESMECFRISSALVDYDMSQRYKH